MISMIIDDHGSDVRIVLEWAEDGDLSPEEAWSRVNGVVAYYTEWRSLNGIFGDCKKHDFFFAEILSGPADYREDYIGSEGWPDVSKSAFCEELRAIREFEMPEMIITLPMGAVYREGPLGDRERIKPRR